MSSLGTGEDQVKKAGACREGELSKAQAIPDPEKTVLMRPSNGPARAQDRESQRWPHTGGLVECERNMLRNLWDPVQNENVGPLLKSYEEF